MDPSTGHLTYYVEPRDEEVAERVAIRGADVNGWWFTALVRLCVCVFVGFV